MTGSARTAAAVGLAAAATLVCALMIANAAGVPASLAVTGIANVFFASRTMAALPAGRRFAELPVVAVLIAVAAVFGHVLVAAPAVGAVLLAVAVAASVWTRRFGPGARRVGRLAAAPFVSVLVVPAPAIGAGVGGVVLVPVVAVLGQALVATAFTVLRVHGETAEAPPHPSTRRLDASARQAIQILVALLAAFAVGFLLFERHWPWVVITAHVVQIGARGRGHALLKAIERLGGAVAGTVVGIAVAAVPLPTPVRVVLILAVLTVAVGLRARSAVWWAAGVTTALALLYDVLGIGSSADLLPRVVAVVVGGLLAGTVSWFVLPIRSRDVLRRRVADHLAAVQDALRAARDGEGVPLATVRAAAARVEELAPTHRAHARVARAAGRPTPREAGVVALVGSVEEALERLLADPPSSGLGALERQVGALRRLNGRRPDVERPPLSDAPPLRPLTEALDALWDALSDVRP